MNTKRRSWGEVPSLEVEVSALADVRRGPGELGLGDLEAEADRAAVADPDLGVPGVEAQEGQLRIVLAFRKPGRGDRIPELGDPGRVAVLLQSSRQAGDEVVVLAHHGEVGRLALA